MHSSRFLSGDDMKSFRAGHSQQQQPKSRRLPDTTSQITRLISHEQQRLKLNVIEALTDMNITLTTAEIDAIVGLLMLHRCTPSPFRFSSSSLSSSSVQTTSLSRRIASGSVTKQVITSTPRKRPRAKQKLNDEKRVVAHHTPQVPDSSSFSFTAPTSHPGLVTSQPNATQYHQAESTHVSLTPSTIISAPDLSQTVQAEYPSVSELYPRLPRVVFDKKGECLRKVSKSHHLTSTAHPTHNKAKSLSSTNSDAQETQQQRISTPPLSQTAVTNQEAPAAPLSEPTTLRPQEAPASQHQHQHQHSPRPETNPQIPPSSKSNLHSTTKSQPRSSQPQPRRPLLPKPLPTPALAATATAPASTSTPVTTKSPKKRKKYGTAYEVSRARQIQASGVPRLPGPCRSCARRQRQLDEVAALIASNAAKGPPVGAVRATEGATRSAESAKAAGENMAGPAGMKKKGMGRFARPQRGDEFLPCMVLSNGISVDDEKRNGDGTGTGAGTGPTPCARCKSIKMKCEG